MIGYLAEFQKEKFDQIVFEKAKQLCFDNDKKIKLIMCNEVLEKIVKVIDKEQREYKIMSKINQLIYDESIEVKAATISLLTRIINLFPDSVKKSSLT